MGKLQPGEASRGGKEQRRVGRVLQTDREAGTKAWSYGVPSCKVRTKPTCPGRTVEG